MTTSVVLDSGALSAWAASDRRVVAALEGVRRANGHVVVPTVVVAESTTGDSGRDATVNRRLKGVVLDSCDDRRARRAAAFRFASSAVGDVSVVDAVVVATAEGRRVPVVTRDAGDLRVLGEAATGVRIVALEDLL